MLHQRSPKDSAIAVIVYERDLLRHCATTVDAKRLKSEKLPCNEFRADYFLAIEGFLLHFRNLLAFFINRGHHDTDLTLARFDKWSDGQTVDKAFCEKLTARAQAVNRKYCFSAKADCHQKISWFLQHCTDYRYRERRSWDLAGMFADFSPIVDEFIARYRPGGAGTPFASAVLSQADYGTMTVTSSSSPLGLGSFSYNPSRQQRKPGGGSKS